MRLTPDQLNAIRSASIAAFSSNVGVWLFGSRVHDDKKGGDIDLLVRPDQAAGDGLFSRKIRFLTELERRLGERKIDVVIETPNDTRPIVNVAHTTGLRIV
ncbi:nucleotidyltransferase domain-containing protein [Rhodoferax sp.]|uniref:nucleotidyltransferase family protein n=1 Tax=Rhodoferax sp. TaxID=50421 RepID=UPI002605DE3F|nr:nucleotidyltransferase domain-containing protein [Rhodoferax sp.]MDD5478778.1 nucleotidyltransferase domain-containing protein [Rhodoferax sp.]